MGLFKKKIDIKDTPEYKQQAAELEKKEDETIESVPINTTKQKEQEEPNAILEDNIETDPHAIVANMSRIEYDTRVLLLIEECVQRLRSLEQSKGSKK